MTVPWMRRFLLVFVLIMHAWLIVSLVNFSIHLREKESASTAIRIDLITPAEPRKIELIRRPLSVGNAGEKKPNSQRNAIIVKPEPGRPEEQTIRIESSPASAEIPLAVVLEVEPLVINLKRMRQSWQEPISATANRQINGSALTKDEKMSQSIKSAVKPYCKDAGLPGAGLLSLAAIAVAVANSDCLR
jgi:hypothetical protein